jgi:hypothetical protein
MKERSDKEQHQYLKNEFYIPQVFFPVLRQFLWTDPEFSRKLRLPDFKITGT